MTLPRLTELLSRLQDVRIGVAGDYCLDAYWHLDTGPSEISLETGKPTLAVDQQRYTLGGAGNVVTNIAALGVRNVRAFGVLGEDLFGWEMTRQLKDHRIDIDRLVLQSSGWVTPVYAKPYLGAEEQNRVDFGRNNSLSRDSEKQFISALTGGMKSVHALVINQQLPLGLFTPGVIRALNDLARRYPQVVFLLDSRHRIFEFQSMTCKLNAIEAARLFGKTIGRNELATTEDLHGYSKQLFDRFRRPVFITRSRLGIILFDGEKATEIPALHVGEPIDPVGAGDTVVAVIAAVLSAGGSLAEAATVAMLAAAITDRKLQQTGTATPQEILSFAENSTLSSSEILIG